MALAWLGPNLPEQCRVQYAVVLHYKLAILYNIHLAATGCTSSATRLFQRLKFEHINAGLAVLNRINVLCAPTLLLMQTLLTGVSNVVSSSDSPADLAAFSSDQGHSRTDDW